MTQQKPADHDPEISSPLLQVFESRHAAPSEYVVVQHLDRLLRERVLMPGDRLPSELGLAKELSVPRSAVSSIYIKLEMFGLVQARPQSGTYLTKMSGFAFEGFLRQVMKLASQDMDLEDLRYLYDLRRSHEKFVARAAAERATPRDIERLREVAREVSVSILDGNGSIEADLLFHLTIAEIAGRPILRTIGLIVAASTIRSFTQVSERVSRADMRARWTASMSEHDRIVDAIALSDPDAAERAVEAHFSNSATFLGIGDAAESTGTGEWNGRGNPSGSSSGNLNR